MTLTWSGAPDLPQVPFGRLFRRLDRAVPEGAQIVTAYTDGQVTLRSNRAKIGYHEAADLSGFKGVEVGDFVVHGLDILRGSVGIADSAGAITAVCTVCEPLVDLDLRYVAHVIRVQAKSGFTRALARGIREGGADFRRWGTLAELPIPMPSVGYQRAVCDYLDRETARIDTLIEEQQHLIEMLDERRDAVIAETTTKGVSPGVALVESGVEWLGDIPEGWSVKALRRCGTLLTGSTPPTDDRSNFAEEANERPWVRPQDLSSETRASAWLTAEGWRQLRPVPAGSVLVGCIAYSLGSVGYLPVAATTNQQITSVVPAEDGRYLYYVLHAAKSELWAASQLNRVPILNNQRLGAIRVPVPPVEEQRLIAAYLDEQTEGIDRAKAETERFIELARERRAALITAAVTGQIDVREMA